MNIMPTLDPSIDVLSWKTWMAGSSPAKTVEN
jgi:hypothetical protein